MQVTDDEFAALRTVNTTTDLEGKTVKSSGTVLVAVALAGLVVAGCTASPAGTNTPASPSATASGSAAPDESAQATSGGAEASSTSAVPSPTDDRAALLEAAVIAYSDAFLSADANASYDLLSDRCQDRNSEATWAGLMAAVEGQFGSPLPLRSYESEISGDFARVTYTYDVASINQDREPWVWERGGWRQDDC